MFSFFNTKRQSQPKQAHDEEVHGRQPTSSGRREAKRQKTTTKQQGLEEHNTKQPDKNKSDYVNMDPSDLDTKQILEWITNLRETCEGIRNEHEETVKEMTLAKFDSEKISKEENKLKSARNKYYMLGTYSEQKYANSIRNKYAEVLCIKETASAADKKYKLLSGHLRKLRKRHYTIQQKLKLLIKQYTDNSNLTLKEIQSFNAEEETPILKHPFEYEKN